MNIILTIAAFLFCVGTIIILTKKNAIFILIGLELMFNASIINFVHFSEADILMQGQMAALFIMVLAVIETALALAIIFKVYKHYQTVDLDKINELKN